MLIASVPASSQSWAQTIKSSLLINRPALARSDLLIQDNHRSCRSKLIEKNYP